MSDVLLYHTPDNGEININRGEVELSAGLRTAAYLSLFGGNEDDPGGSDETLSWWGNVGEVVQFRSETQHLLNATNAAPRNLRRVEQAALRDLAWMISDSVASEITAEATIPGLNRVKLVVTITAEGQESRFAFSENWKATA